MSFDINSLRNEFPALSQVVNGQPLVYLDSAATSLKPRPVIDRLNKFYCLEAANVHRGAHYLSDRATELYEGAREKVAQFINAKSSKEVVFVRGTTEGINLLATSLGEGLHEGDEIILSDLEHHANIVPWQMLAQRKKLVIKVLETSPQGEVTEYSLKSLLGPRTKILSITHASNHLGNVVPLEKIIPLARQAGVIVIVDGAQAIGKMVVDVQKLDADFYVFSGHKAFAPFGIGVVYGKEALLEKMPPYQGGGSMIASVTFAKTTFNDIPFRFEAGTPNIGGAVALAEAFRFIDSIGMEQILKHDLTITNYAEAALNSLDLEILGTKKGTKIPIFAFNVPGLHATDVGFLLNQQGIAVRTGHHCTQPLLQKLKLTGSIRASFSIYNSIEEVDALVAALKKAKEILL